MTIWELVTPPAMASFRKRWDALLGVCCKVMFDRAIAAQPLGTPVAAALPLAGWRAVFPSVALLHRDRYNPFGFHRLAPCAGLKLEKKLRCQWGHAGQIWRRGAGECPPPGGGKLCSWLLTVDVKDFSLVVHGCAAVYNRETNEKMKWKIRFLTNSGNFKFLAFSEFFWHFSQNLETVRSFLNISVEFRQNFIKIRRKIAKFIYINNWTTSLTLPWLLKFYIYLLFLLFCSITFALSRSREFQTMRALSVDVCEKNNFQKKNL